MCKVEMERELFIRTMSRAKNEIIKRYCQGEVGRNEYMDKIEKINSALLNDKLGLNIYR